MFIPALAPPLAGVAPAIPEAAPPVPPVAGPPPFCEPLEPALANPPLPPVAGELGASDGDEHAAETTASASSEQSAPALAGRGVKGIPIS
jgi:hypothetical protein